MPKVVFVNEKKEIEVPPGSNLRTEARQAGIEVHGTVERFLNCLGHGICGTCRVVVKKGTEKQLMTDVQVPANLVAPAHRGDVIGEVRVKQQDQILVKTAAVVPEEIPQVSLFWRLFGR